MNKSTLTPEFENMLNLAKAYFEEAKSQKFEYHQCLVLKTAQDEELIYSFACDSIKELIEQSCSILDRKNFSNVTNIVCMWEGDSIDVPSHQFIKKLCELNPKNKEAEILLNSSPTSCVYISKKISDILI